MRNSSNADFEKAVADFQYDVASAQRHRDGLDRENWARTEARARFRDWGAARAAGAAIRDADLLHLERRLADFAARFESAGGRLHWAPSAGDAREALVRIAKEAGVRSCVRGLSSTLEEIGADEALGTSGVAVRHSQFGDMVNHLRGGRPSHMLHPAMHLSREEVGETLHAKMGSPTTSNPEEQVALVRKSLRESFLQADMGLAGASFLLAEEGKVALVEHEGNLRLIASMPRVFVVVAGIEKVTESVSDLPLLLQLVGASAGGTALPSGVSLIGPDTPRACGETAVMHLILVDNGRSLLLADTASAEALRCVKCGACADICPVYRMAGGRAYGSVLPGPIGAVLTRHLMPARGAQALPLATPLCGACGDVCPVGIDLHRALVSQRREMPPASRGWKVNAMLRLHERMMSSQARYNRGTRIVRILAVLADLTRKTSFNPLSDWMRHRTLPETPKKTFRGWWKSTAGATSSAARKDKA